MTLYERLWVLALLLSQSIVAHSNDSPAVTKILDGVALHPEGDRNVFAMPIDVSGNALVTAHVEPSAGQGRDGVNLRTVVRLGVKSADGTWRWTTQLIEARTLLDPWHTQASVAFDKRGHVHIAYNMHNMPWQYVVSKRPYDIGEFAFKGQPVS
ncbi:MAG: BNR-4 repeat-containing protein, partial [Hyphomonadaceae bacterium]